MSLLFAIPGLMIAQDPASRSMGKLSAGGLSGKLGGFTSTSLGVQAQAVPTKVFGIDFSPYLTGQNPNLGTQITSAQILSRLQTVAPYTVWIRSFSSTKGLENTPTVARQLGLKVAANAWISGDLSQNSIEIQNLITAANAGLVDVAIVGSEAILRNDVTVSQLIAYMNQVRQAIPKNIPVTTADIWGTFIANPSLVAASDVVYANFYPYWEGTSITNAMCSLTQEYQRLVTASGAKPVVVSETGWPSAGNPVGAAVPSPTNAAMFALQFFTWASQNSIQAFYFEAFDEKWKTASEGPQGANWGIWDENAVLKPGMDAFFNGQSSSLDCNTTLPGTPSITPLYVPPYGSSDALEVQVRGVQPANYAIATYINVRGGWWTKPYFVQPTVPINPDGTAAIPIVTGGIDDEAIEIEACLIKSGTQPPLASGGAKPLFAVDVPCFDITRTQSSISGKITDSQSNPIAGAVLKDLVLGSTTSAPDGKYSFYNITASGNATLSVTYSNYSFPTSPTSIAISSGNQIVNFSGMPGVDLSVVGAISPSSVLTGSSVTETVVVSNAGSGSAKDGTLTLSIPGSFMSVKVATTRGSCSAVTQNAATQIVTCGFGPLSATAYATVTVTATAGAVGMYTFGATVSGSDPDSDLSNNATTQKVTVYPPGSPSVWIDAPAIGAQVSGNVTISGWAIDNLTAISSVKIFVDGTLVGTASYGISRPDVCIGSPGRPGCPNVGFSFVLNTAIFSPGSHIITAVATDSDAVPDSGSVSVVVTVMPLPTVLIDSPTAGSVVSGTIAIAGWALDNVLARGTLINAVQVFVDGIKVGNAQYGLNRPDVCVGPLATWPGCPNVGYTFALNTSTLSPGAHKISVSATDSDAVPDTGSSSVNVTVTTPPAVYVDVPTAGAAISGIVTVKGWAIDNSVGVGTAINSVQILVDGVKVGNATYGVNRSDVCVGYPGRPGCPNVGFTYQLDATKLSVGAHTLTAVATDSDPVPDSASWTTNIQVITPPSVWIDAPAAGAQVSGNVMISGWALDNLGAPSTAISSVKILVDGTSVGTASYGISRPDVCAGNLGRTGCPNVGFSYVLNTAALSPGSHIVTAVATDSDSVPDAGSVSVTVMVMPFAPTVLIDSPTAGSVVSGTIAVAGWALDNVLARGTLINAVQVFVDGIKAGSAQYGLSRPDVCVGSLATWPGCPNVGYTFALNTSTLSPGAHKISVSAIDSDAVPDTGSSSVNITVTTPPAVYVDVPTAGAAISGIVTVNGWAIDNSVSVGTAINSVQILVDGIKVGNATYGVNRSDVCVGYPGRPGCPNVGFTYQLDATKLSKGAHTLTAVATDSDPVPDSASWTVNLKVQ